MYNALSGNTTLGARAGVDAYPSAEKGNKGGITVNEHDYYYPLSVMINLSLSLSLSLARSRSRSLSLSFSLRNKQQTDAKEARGQGRF